MSLPSQDAIIIIDGCFPFRGAVAPSAAKNKCYDLTFSIDHLCNGAKNLILPSQWVSQGEANLPPIYQQNPFYLKYQYGFISREICIKMKTSIKYQFNLILI